MKARPILFSGPMVRALLDGRKTQTRRIVRPQPFNGASDSEIIEQIGGLLPGRSLSSMVQDAWETGFVDILCPYGKPGDVLWVRETWKPHSTYADTKPSAIPPSNIFYAADDAYSPSNTPWRPSIFMPRWASRITLEIESIRVERLQDISEEDARAEGIDSWRGASGDPRTGVRTLYGAGNISASDPVQAFELLWQSINGEGSWAANPWVWVVEFKPRLVNVDEFLKQREAA